MLNYRYLLYPVIPVHGPNINTRVSLYYNIFIFESGKIPLAAHAGMPSEDGGVKQDTTALYYSSTVLLMEWENPVPGTVQYCTVYRVT